MVMFHTSPEEIKEPNENGRYGKGIFFSQFSLLHGE